MYCCVWYNFSVSYELIVLRLQMIIYHFFCPMFTRYTIPIDHIGFEFEVLRFEHEEDVDGKPDDGWFVQ